MNCPYDTFREAWDSRLNVSSQSLAMEKGARRITSTEIKSSIAEKRLKRHIHGRANDTDLSTRTHPILTAHAVLFRLALLQRLSRSRHLSPRLRGKTSLHSIISRRRLIEYTGITLGASRCSAALLLYNRIPSTRPSPTWLWSSLGFSLTVFKCLPTT